MIEPTVKVKNEELNCSHKNLEASDITRLSQEMQFDVSKIRILKLGYNRLGDAGAQVISSILPHLHCIDCLDLGFNGIGDCGLEYLSSWLSVSPTLKILYLSGNHLTEIGFRHLSIAITHNQCLQKLYLTGNSGRTKGAQCLAEGLMRNRSLEMLCLNGNAIGVGGCKAIAHALQTNSTVKYLNLVSFYPLLCCMVLRICACVFVFQLQSANVIGDMGISSLSEACHSSTINIRV